MNGIIKGVLSALISIILLSKQVGLAAPTSRDEEDDVTNCKQLLAGYHWLELQLKIGEFEWQLVELPDISASRRLYLGGELIKLKRRVLGSAQLCPFSLEQLLAELKEIQRDEALSPEGDPLLAETMSELQKGQENFSAAMPGHLNEVPELEEQLQLRPLPFRQRVVLEQARRVLDYLKTLYEFDPHFAGDQANLTVWQRLQKQLKQRAALPVPLHVIKTVAKVFALHAPSPVVEWQLLDRWTIKGSLANEILEGLLLSRALRLPSGELIWLRFDPVAHRVGLEKAQGTQGNRRIEFELPAEPELTIRPVGGRIYLTVQGTPVLKDDLQDGQEDSTLELVLDRVEGLVELKAR